VVFILGSIKFADFEENAVLEESSGTSKWFDGGFTGFMEAFPLTLW
jgi:hypothetical protein